MDDQTDRWKGKIIELEGSVGASPANDRKKGFDETIKAKAPGMVILASQSGDFAREWIAENRAGQESFKRMRAEQAHTQIETVGGELRSHMDWIKPSF